MIDRKDWSEADKEAAWENVTGVHPDSTKLYSTAKCPYKNCTHPTTLMHWNDYGAQTPTQWVIDHIKPISKGGTNDHRNLQAMHNGCNALKGDDY